ncbi:MAG: segregation and condensation protein A [Nitrospirota bacterium]
MTDQPDESSVAYQVKLPVFEGPLDLLLHLIKEHRVDIYDIPIALITKQYLEYLDLLKELNLSVAGEFLVMAATLVQIKSRMLLPREEQPESAEPEEDPREELVRRLVEYQRFKDAAEALEDREAAWRDVFRREPTPLPQAEPAEYELGELSVFDLLTSLRDVLDRVPDPAILEVTVETLTVRDRMTAIIERFDVLADGERVRFHELFEGAATRTAVIVTFLALLELVKIHVLGLRQSGPSAEIEVLRMESVPAGVGGDENGPEGDAHNG